MISWTDLLSLCSKNRILPSYPARYTAFNTAPLIVVWNVTSLCNLNCIHCYFYSEEHNTKDELSTEDAKIFIDDISEFGVKILLFSGGEPLLRNDIFELASFAEGRGIKPVLSTNGTLIGEEVAKRIKKAGFSYVSRYFTSTLSCQVTPFVIYLRVSSFLTRRKFCLVTCSGHRGRSSGA